MTADGNTADCEFDGVELYSDNGQDSVYTIDYKFNGEVPAGKYELKFENYGYYESEVLILLLKETGQEIVS